jgi:hypothetical protein
MVLKLFEVICVFIIGVHDILEHGVFTLAVDSDVCDSYVCDGSVGPN